MTHDLRARVSEETYLAYKEGNAISNNGLRTPNGCFYPDQPEFFDDLEYSNICENSQNISSESFEDKSKMTIEEFEELCLKLGMVLELINKAIDLYGPKAKLIWDKKISPRIKNFKNKNNKSKGKNSNAEIHLDEKEPNDSHKCKIIDITDYLSA